MSTAAQLRAQEERPGTPVVVEELPAPVLYKKVGPLLEALAAVKTFSANYQEEKKIDLLLEPLKSHGTVYFNAARKRLARHTVAPFPSVLVVTQKWIGVREGSAWEVVDLGRQPVVMQIVSGFMKVLAGDEEGLKKIYTIKFSPEQDVESGWTITLIPRVQPLSKIIASIAISGHGVDVAQMRVLEVCGDETLTIFSSIKRDVIFSEKEAAAFFPVPEERKDRK